jgi:hypothetical protein
MYFSSKKGKWYNHAVQTRPLYRYLLTAFLLIIVLGCWWFGLYAYLEQSIANDRVALAQMNKQLIQLAQAERTCSNLSSRLPQLKEKISCYGNKSCLPGFCQMQIDTVIDEAHKAGLQISSYEKDQETIQDYCRCSDVQFGFVGTLDSVVRFFSALRQSKALIECNSFSCDRIQDGNYNIFCKLAFVSIASAA